MQKIRKYQNIKNVTTKMSESLYYIESKYFFVICHFSLVDADMPLNKLVTDLNNAKT